ncbi:MAG TPA: Fic family protein [Opitutaceae bacterium]|jgi:Fic family protein|nr:Fic family protein [Opitutaceae bacterium]
MNSALFGEHKTGQLVPIKVNTQDDFAFLPNPLPPTGWIFPNKLWPMLVKAKEALGTLNGSGKNLRDPQLLLSPLGRREAITSSALEGTYATPQELMLFELSPTKPKSESDPANEWKEVYNYYDALKEGGKSLGEGMPFCLRMFKSLHEKLLGGTRHRYTSPGEFRKHQVAIGSDRRYIPPTVDHLDKCLADLEAYINAEHGDLDPLVRAYLAHYQFEAIHPFYDGNGRIGRVLLSLMVYKWCNFKCPWLYMSAYFERYKDEYISKMFKISTDGAWDDWLEFCLRGTIVQAEDAIRRCDALLVLKEDMEKRINDHGGTVRSQRILNGLFSSPFVRVSSLARKLEVAYPTAQEDIDRLVKVGILSQIEGVRPKSYAADEIFAIAYDPAESLR